ncbi:MAG: right-handed parallel beta-helix repeat-containing protein [Clostridiales bacterium]|jgi:hypothetical protein|nr:right-handed parallel beta-helix repeat-containing protein [Clostridiales bacterium]
MLFKTIRDYGAVGDGMHDDTPAVQAAIDDCGIGGAAIVPEGTYLVADVRMKPNVALVGASAWGYRDGGQSACLAPAKENAACLINITNAIGCSLRGLSLDGRGIGDGMHGIMIRKNGFGEQEDAIHIENCRASRFTGDALRLERAWCLTARGNMFSSSKNGMYVDGWNLFLYDNWLTGNRERGLCAMPGANTSVIFQGNRVEWNGMEGIMSADGANWILNGNYFDHNGLDGAKFVRANHVNITGNIFARDGWRAGSKDLSASLSALSSGGICVTSNVFLAMSDDTGRGPVTPEYNLVIRGLRASVVTGNSMHEAATKQNVLDLGGHDNSVIKDNAASLSAYPKMP